MSSLPFEGIRVADFGWVLAAPYMTQCLSVLGAEVIRVESRVHPDTIRVGTHGGNAEGVPGLDRSGSFASLNYSKRLCVLDLNRPEARKIAYQLVSISDIVVEAFTSRVARRFGLSYEDLVKVRPDVILFSCSALGRTGPLKDITGFGPNTQIFAGLPAISGYPGKVPGALGGTWPDYMCGMGMAFPLLAALHHRQRTGEGQHVDYAMGEAVTGMIPEAIMDYAMNGRVAQPRGNRDDHMAPHNTYRCQGNDKWVAIAVGSDEEWRALGKATGHPEWLADPRFADGLARWQNQEELDKLITEWTKEYTPYEVMEILQRAGVAAGPSLNTEELINDPQMQHRGLFVEMDHAEVGRRLLMGMPTKFSALEPKLKPTHLMGQDNYEVFCDLLGTPREEVDRLIEEKIIY